MNKFFLLVCFTIIACSSSFSQIIVGYNNPPAANCVNSNTIGTLVWQSPGNVSTSNDSRAFNISGQQGVTNYLQTTNFGFIIPPTCPTCVVTGVEASVERRAAFQPDVAILNNWLALTKSGAGYNYTVTPGNPPAIMNRALIVVIGIENGPRPLLEGGPINPPAAGNDSRDVISVTYGGVQMMQACEVTYSSIISGTNFWARNEIWFLNDAGITSAVGNQIVITNPGNSYEYVELVSAVSFQNVDQLAPVFASRTDTVVGNVNPFALGNPAPMLQGSCAVTSIVCGNPGSYVFNSGGASGLAGVNFIEGTDQNGLLIPGYGSSTPTMMTGHAIVPDGISGNVSPTYQYTGYAGNTPNRQVISMICVQRARDFDNQVRLIKGGIVSGNNLSISTTYPKTDAYQSYGGAGNLWGLSLSPSDVTASNFGFAMSSRVQNRQIEVDHIRMRIFFTNPLPVELIDFTGKRIDRNIELTWSTASENNNDYFELHRSEDAIQYQIVNTIDGAGTSNNILQYIYDDVDASETVINYYKIRQMDYNGNFKWYGPISVEPGERENSFNVFPNPAITSIQITNMNVIDQYYIYNNSGQLVQSGKMENDQINVDELTPGVYFISIADNGQKIKFLKF